METGNPGFCRLLCHLFESYPFGFGFEITLCPLTTGKRGGYLQNDWLMRLTLEGQ